MTTLLIRNGPELNMNRWYNDSVQPTPLDRRAVICAGGNRRASYMRLRALSADSSEAATLLADNIVIRKVRRGYIVSPCGD